MAAKKNIAQGVDLEDFAVTRCKQGEAKRMARAKVQASREPSLCQKSDGSVTDSVKESVKDDPLQGFSEEGPIPTRAPRPRSGP